MRRNRCCPALVLSALLSATSVEVRLHAGQAEPAGADGGPLRISASTVLVDVVVTDRSNRPVTDLVPEEFLLFEDGVPRAIDHAWLVHPGFGNEQPGREPSSTSTGWRLLEPTPVRVPRLLVFLLDYATLRVEHQESVRRALREFVDTRMAPNDLAAVFLVGRSFRMLQNFTDDRETLLDVLDVYDGSGSAYAGDQAFLTDLMSDARENVEVMSQVIDGLASSGPAAGPQVQLLVEQLMRQMKAAEAKEGQYLAQRSYSRELQGRSVVRAIEAIAMALRPMEGRKTMVLISEGFAVPAHIERDFYRAVQAANSARMAIYTIDGGGLRLREPSEQGPLFQISALRSGDRTKAYGGLSQFDLAREVGTDVAGDTLRYVAAATGGRYIHNTNDFLGALERVATDAGTHYLLAFRPSLETWDGRYHDLEVRVRRPGLEVRARPGYWSLPPGASVLTGEEYQRLMEPWPASSGRKNGGELKIGLQTAAFPREDGVFSVIVEVEAPSAQFRVQREGEAAAIECRVAGLVRNAAGDVVTSFRGPDRLAITGNAEAVPETVQWLGRLQLPPGEYVLEVLVEDGPADRWGRVARGLRLVEESGDWDVSDLILGFPAVDENARRSLPFRGEGFSVSPSALRVSRRDQPMAFFLQVVAPEGSGNGAQGNLEMRVSLVRGVDQVVVSRERLVFPAPEPTLSVARLLTLGGMSPGNYRLVVFLESETGETRTAVAGFVLE